jgi:hypothetical protein
MQPVRVLEPRTDIKADVEQNHVVLQGGMRITHQVNNADSSNNTQSLWSVYPPSPQTIVDRLVKVRLVLKLTLNTRVDREIGPVSLRQFPLHSILDVLTVQINGESISDNVGDKIHAMLCYGNTPEDRNKTWSQTASQPDQFMVYQAVNVEGSARNTFAKYGENVVETSRGGFPVVYANEDGKDVGEFTWTITEPLLLSPFYTGLGGQQEGFVNVNQFNFSLRYKDLREAIKANVNLDINSVDIVGQPQLLTTYITPDLTQPIPTLQTLPYYKTLDYIKDVGTYNRGTQVNNFQSDTIRLSQIPRKLYVFIRRKRNTVKTGDDPDQVYKTEDTYAYINRMSILWNNQSGLLANASAQDLHEISVRNGCNLSWTQWAEQRGSVMCIEFGKDIGLLDNEAPGVRGQHVIQISTDFKTLSENGWQGEAFYIFAMEGTFQISENVGKLFCPKTKTTLGNKNNASFVNPHINRSVLCY